MSSVEARLTKVENQVKTLQSQMEKVHRHERGLGKAVHNAQQGVSLDKLADRRKSKGQKKKKEKPKIDRHGYKHKQVIDHLAKIEPNDEEHAEIMKKAEKPLEEKTPEDYKQIMDYVKRNGYQESSTANEFTVDIY